MINQSIAILDYGSQYTQLIARRVRELNVYCEIFNWDTPQSKIFDLSPAAFILSGGPASVYAHNAPQLASYIIESHLPILGICYGMQLLALALDGKVSAAADREYGLAEIECKVENPLLEQGRQTVWMSHGDQVTSLPPGFTTLASTANSPIAAMGHLQKHVYGLQFHPEVRHTPSGMKILSNFVFNVCGLKPGWTPENIISQSISQIREQVGDETVIAAVSGGVDSSVATALVHRAIGPQLSAVFVDTGLLRLGEADQVENTLKKQLGIKFTRVNAAQQFFAALSGAQDPETKRRIIGAKFIEIFEHEATLAGNPPYLVQGTIYPDVVESSGSDHGQTQKIKSHHNVGGLPERMKFKLIEPLRFLFKDEVRKIGEALGIPAEMVWRQPFPGPGLAVRCLGQLTEERIRCLQQIDAIFISELEHEGLINRKSVSGQPELAQAFAVLLPIRSVGVMGDQRTYMETAALRAVTSEDFMTADWAQLSPALLGRISTRIVNEVAGVNRVVYDITSKPPATIEWE